MIGIDIQIGIGIQIGIFIDIGIQIGIGMIYGIGMDLIEIDLGLVLVFTLVFMLV